MSLLSYLSFIPIFSVIAENKVINNFSCSLYEDSSSDTIGTMVVSPLYINTNLNNNTFININTLKGFCLYIGKQCVGINSDINYQSFKYITLEGDLLNQVTILLTETGAFDYLIEQIKELINICNIKEISEEEYLSLIK